MVARHGRHTAPAAAVTSAFLSLITGFVVHTAHECWRPAGMPALEDGVCPVASRGLPAHLASVPAAFGYLA